MTDTVTIKCKCLKTGKPLEFEAEILAAEGPLAVIEYPAFTYSVTHIASGFRATASHSFTAAKRAMRELAQLDGIQWDRITGADAKKFITEEASQQIARIKATTELDLD